MSHPDYLDVQDRIEVVAGEYDGIIGVVVRDWIQLSTRHVFPVTKRCYGVRLYDGHYAEIRRRDMRKIGVYA